MKPKYAWRQIHDIHIFVDGDQYFPALLDACANATLSIHISLYWFESGAIGTQFITALVAAAQRGVRVSCLLDVFGSMSLTVVDQQKLMDGGILLGWYNPIYLEKLHLILNRDHTKLFAIDGHTLFIGGTGIADIFMPCQAQTENNHQIKKPTQDHNKTGYYWRENMFQLTGPILIDCLDYLYNKWLSKNTVISSMPEWANNLKQAFLPTQSDFPQPYINTSNTAIQSRWLESKGGIQRHILHAVIKRIKQSKNTVIIATAYFAPDPRLRWALKQAAQRGVKVTLLLPGVGMDHPLLLHAGQYFYLDLLKKGIHIFEYKKRFMHSKIVVCDNFVCFGSSNLDSYTQRWSLEANIEIESQTFSQQVQSILQFDIHNSEAVNLERWKKRYFWQKLMCFLAYRAGSILDFWARQLFLYDSLYSNKGSSESTPFQLDCDTKTKDIGS